MNQLRRLFKSFERRVRQPELMDQPGLDERRHRRALDALRRVNALSRSGAVLWSAVEPLARRSDEPLRILDVACGGGDVGISLARRAKRAGCRLHIDGCDLSPAAVAYARSRAEIQGADAGFFEQDALAEPLPAGYDVIVCSLFLHHLSEAEAVTLLGRMADAAGRLVLIDDLVRSRLGYLLALVGTRLLTRSAIVHTDGPRSVLNAFTPNEALQLADQAGLAGTRLIRHWPQRFLLYCPR